MFHGGKIDCSYFPCFKIYFYLYRDSMQYCHCTYPLWQRQKAKFKRGLFGCGVKKVKSAEKKYNKTRKANEMARNY
jgi:hypothetical protein